MFISLPVCGLRPLRAALVETEKDPNPTNATRSPPLRASPVAPITLVLKPSKVPSTSET